MADVHNDISTSQKKNNREFLFSLVFSVASAVLGFVFSFLAAKFLESDRYGQVQYYVSIANIVLVFLLFGSRNRIIRGIQFAENKKAEISRYYILILITSAIILPFYFIIAYFLLNKLGQNILLISCIYVLAILLAFAELVYSFFIGLNHNELKPLFAGIYVHAFFLILFGVHYFTNSLQNFVDWYICYYIAGMLVFVVPALVISFRKTKFKFSKSELVSQLIFCATYICYNIKTTLGNVIVGEAYEGFSIVGIISISTQIIAAAGLVSGIITFMAMPVFSKLHAMGEQEKMFKMFDMVTRLTCYINIPFFMAFAVEAHGVLALFGESYMGYDLTMTLLSISALVDCLTGPCQSILIMSGNERYDLYAALAQFAAYLITIAVLLNVTVYAIPIASLVAMVIANVIKMILTSIKFHHNFFSWRVWLPALVIAVISFGAFFGLSFIDNWVLWLILNCIVGASLILGCIFLSPFQKDKHFLWARKDNFDAYL